MSWKAGNIVSLSKLSLFTVTFNVNAKSADPENVDMLLKIQLEGTGISEPDLVIVGLQEMVPLSTTNVVGTALLGGQLVMETLEKWKGLILNSLNASSAASAGFDAMYSSETNTSYQHLAAMSMVGTALMLFVKSKKFELFRNIQSAVVTRGIGKVLGNKGAVCIRFDVGDTSVCIVNAHLSAHREAVQKRNDDYKEIISAKIFSRSTWSSDPCDKLIRPVTDVSTSQLKREIASVHQRAMQQLLSIGESDASLLVSSFIGNDNDVLMRGVGHARNNNNTAATTVQPSSLLIPTMNDTLNDLNSMSPDDHDVVLWMGDQNYRLSSDCDIDDAYEMIDTLDILQLTTYDQLLQEKNFGVIFEGFKEGIINFPPTYQYVSGTNEYDRREGGKNRCPAWCDRILWRVGRYIKRAVNDINAVLETHSNTDDKEIPISSRTVTVTDASATHDLETENKSDDEPNLSEIPRILRRIYDPVFATAPIDMSKFLAQIHNKCNGLHGSKGLTAVQLQLNAEKDHRSEAIVGLESDPKASVVPKLTSPSTLSFRPKSMRSFSPKFSFIETGDDDDDIDNNDDGDDAIGENNIEINTDGSFRSTIGRYGSNRMARYDAFSALSSVPVPGFDIASIIDLLQHEIFPEKMELLLYECCKDVLLSDHLPVRAMFHLSYKQVDFESEENQHALFASRYFQYSTEDIASNAHTPPFTTRSNPREIGPTGDSHQQAWSQCPLAMHLFGVSTSYTPNPHANADISPSNVVSPSAAIENHSNIFSSSGIMSNLKSINFGAKKDAVNPPTASIADVIPSGSALINPQYPFPLFPRVLSNKISSNVNGNDDFAKLLESGDVDKLNQTLLYGMLPCVAIDPSCIIFPVFEIHAGDHEAGGDFDSLYAELTRCNLRVSAGMSYVNGDGFEFQFIEDSIPHWLSINELNGFIPCNTTHTISIALMLHPLEEQELVAKDPARPESDSLHPVWPPSAHTSLSSMSSGGNPVTNSRDRAPLHLSLVAPSSLPQAHFAGQAAPSSPYSSQYSSPHSSGSFSRLSLSRHNVKRQSNTVTTFESKLSQVLTQAKLSGRFSTNKDMTEHCNELLACTLYFQYRKLAKANDCTIFGLDNNNTWSTILIPVACSVSKVSRDSIRL